MAESNFQNKLLEKVLNNYCNDEITRQYQNESTVTKEKILGALKGVFDQVLNDERNKQIEEMSKRPDLNDLKKLQMKEGDIKGSSDPLLHMVLKAMGVTLVIKDLSQLKMCLSDWGKKESRMMKMMIHNFSVQKLKDMQLKHYANDNSLFNYHTNSTYTSAEKICSDFSALKKIFVQELKLFQSATGKYIEGRIITEPLVRVGITTHMEDERGDYVQLALYNAIPACKEKFQLAEMKFPVGSRIKIAQPYYKIFVDGNPGIRVDSPEEIFVFGNERKLNFEEIRTQGRILIQAGDNMAAFDLYLNALSNYSDIATLLNNRSQTELNLQEYEASLLDAAAVLFIDEKNVKARERYYKGIECLGFSKSAVDCINIWKKVLLFESKEIQQRSHGSKEEGNKAFQEGNYLEAKSQYTAAIDGSEISIILNNIAVVSLKSNMLHTAIAAASACLQIAFKEDSRKKARYLMTKSFFLAGESGLAKLSSKTDLSLQTFTEKQNLEEVARHAMQQISNSTESVLLTEECIEKVKDVVINEDYIYKDAIQHCYIVGKGRGLKAKQPINATELLLIDHPIHAGNSFKETKGFTRSVNSNTRLFEIDGHLNLKRMLLSQIKYDGLLAQKLLLLDYRCGKISNDKEIPLVDLEWMAYQKLSYNILPFLPQSQTEVKVDRTKLSDRFIYDILQTNVFEWKAGEYRFIKSNALFLRISLFNHSVKPNCICVPIGNSLVVFAKKFIKAGDELTIAYSQDSDVMKKWGL